MAKKSTKKQAKPSEKRTPPTIVMSKKMVRTVMAEWNRRAVADDWNGDWRDAKAGGDTFWKIAKELFGA